MRPALWISLCLAACGLSASAHTVPTINACINNLSGATRVVVASTNCINGAETFKQWNVTGRKARREHKAQPALRDRRALLVLRDSVGRWG